MAFSSFPNAGCHNSHASRQPAESCQTTFDLFQRVHHLHTRGFKMTLIVGGDGVAME
jgi:hypothetical protein